MKVRLNVWILIAIEAVMFFFFWKVCSKQFGTGEPSNKVATDEPSEGIIIDEHYDKNATDEKIIIDEHYGKNATDGPPDNPSDVIGIDGPFQVNIRGESFYVFADNITFAKEVATQVASYDVSKINFQRGDVVFDVGANIGLFSLVLAKNKPFLNIYALEPEKKNFGYLERNIKANNIENGVIIAINKALNKDGEDVNLMVSHRSTRHTMVDISDTHKRDMFDEELKIETIPGISLSQAFEKFHVEKCRLFKIDCEGCEYDALYHAEDGTLEKIETFRGEFHGFESLLKKGFTASKLLEDMKKKIKDIKVEYFRCYGKEKC